MKDKKVLGFEEEYSRLNDLNAEVMLACMAHLLGGSQTLPLGSLFAFHKRIVLFII